MQYENPVAPEVRLIYGLSIFLAVVAVLAAAGAMFEMQADYAKPVQDRPVLERPIFYHEPDPTNPY